MNNTFKIHKWIFALCYTIAFTACSDDKNSIPSTENKEEGNVLVAVNVSTSAKTRIGDPGSDHQEDEQRWDNLSLYMVYPDGEVTEHTMTRAELESNNPVNFTTWVGTADLYAIAYASPQIHVKCNRPEDVYNLKTLNINSDEFTRLLSDEKRRYMQNVFAGSTLGISITRGSHQTVNITLNRIIAKVDVQYDMADAFDGQYKDVKLQDMTFYGPDYGYFFPDKAIQGTPQQESVTGHYVCDNDISARNGRTYYYSYTYHRDLSDMRHQFTFNVNYTKKDDSTGSTKYTAKFGDSLNANVWYYVTLNIRGNNGFASSGSGEITLTPKQGT